MMKLNYKKTLFVGFAFFLICLFWQAYDNIVPKMLIDKFGMSQTWSGLIMALDNILALFMLPLFGAISDKCKSKRGRRTPFIIVGTLCACVLFVGLSLVDNMQLANLGAPARFVTNEDGLGAIDPEGMRILYDTQKGKLLYTSNGQAFVLGGSADGAKTIPEEDFMSMTAQIYNEKGVKAANPDFMDYVVSARQAYAHEVRLSAKFPLVLFVAVLLLLLISMATFRSPAVALMPDVTIKPLRSKANAIINLMGTAGGITVLVLGMVFSTGNILHSMISYTGYFTLIAGLMLLALMIFLWKVKEPLWAKQMREESERYGIEELDENASAEQRRLSAGEKRSLFFILASIVLWFMGYNAVTSKYSVYAGKVLNLDYNLTLLIAQAAAIISYLPVGIVASKIGRKKTILAGIIMLTASFTTASFLRAGSPALLMNCMFALAGIGWATINVNSFPMVVELAKGGNVGKYTGFYYTASMAAQTLTPLFSGFLMDKTGRMTVLFPYASIFVGFAFFTMLAVKHGDSKPETRKGIEAMDVED
ncbi:MAG: MFS transporter [Sphaerochaetaceae bacterium]